jgi:hypothetical protein
MQDSRLNQVARLWLVSVKIRQTAIQQLLIPVNILYRAVPCMNICYYFILMTSRGKTVTMNINQQKISKRQHLKQIDTKGEQQNTEEKRFARRYLSACLIGKYIIMLQENCQFFILCSLSRCDNSIFRPI